MFSKKQRLNTSLFDEVFNFGKEKRTEYFFIKYQGNDQEKGRFAVVIPKKREKSAVKRHLIKRRFFNALKKSKLNKEKKDFIFLLNEKTKEKKEKDLILIINDLQLK